MATRFGAYEILYELKTGGMGAVLLGRRRGPGSFEQLVAIKTILAGYAQAPAVRAMFLDEAAILARLNHPAVATVHDFGEQSGTLYMVMEYVAGIPLRELAQYGMPPAVAARAIAEACRGVHAAHELRDLSGHLLGVVHRDLSPDNLMFGFDGHVKVIDFGIALVKNRQAPVTDFGTVKGKPPYMSPEQVKNDAIDRRSDVFSLAVVLWELLAGRALFEGNSIYAIALSVEHQQIVPPSEVLGVPLPAGLDDVVMSALDRNPERRTQTAAAFAEQLEQVIQSAGEETLEAWADRVLEDSRMAHRAWLASVVAGKDAPRPIGRPTGSVTALGAPLGKASTVMSGAPAPPVVSPKPREGPAHDDLGRRRVALPILLGALVLVLVVGVLALVRVAGRASHVERDAIAADAAPPARDAVAVVDAAEVIARDAIADAMPDAAPEAPIDAPIDAPVRPPVDAGRPRVVRAPRDAGRIVTIDAALPAAVVDVPSGWGRLTAKHKNDRYLNVLVDGQTVGPTPMFNRRIAAGSHTIELVDPRTGSVVTRHTVTVEDGETVTVVEP